MERLPDNLAALYESFGVDLIDSIGTGDVFEVDGIEFVCGYRPESTAERFYIVKPPELIERYRALCERFAGGTFVELGIAEGGSTALMALWARPRRLVAVDLEPRPLGALAEFIAGRGIDDAVRPRYGVDQGDRALLQRIVADDLDGGPIDVVVDDCSHDVDLTRASFDALFPFLRPGGVFVIEDWSNDIVFQASVVAALRDPDRPDRAEVQEAMREAMRGAVADGARPTARVPLARLALELVVAKASTSGVIDVIEVNDDWIVVTRGEADLDPATFGLAGLYEDHYGIIGRPG